MARRRRHPGFFDEFDLFEEMRRLFEELDLDELREGKPLIYGFNVRVGPEGEPIVEQFGNVKPDEEGRPALSEKREPLVDVIEREEDITVMAEIPGVEKEDIKLHLTETMLTIDAKSYHRKVKLPARVLKEGAKAHYKNGVLEVVLKKVEKSKPKETELKVE